MIQSHLYARKSEIGVFERCGDTGMPLYRLKKGSWVGVVERCDDWIRVISSDCAGWIRAEDLEARPPFELHAHWSASGPIAYVNSPEGELPEDDLDSIDITR